MSGIYDSLRRVLTDWFGWGTAVERLELTFEHTWPWPPWITLLTVLLVAAAVLLIYWYESRSRRRHVLAFSILRIALVGLVVFMMYGWRQQQHRTAMPDIVIAVDASASMAFVDDHRDQDVQQAAVRLAGEKPKRIELAQALLLSPQSDWLRKLEARYHLRLFQFGPATQHLAVESGDMIGAARDLQALGDVSRLGRGVEQILAAQRGRSTAAVILLTDGINTSGPSISTAAAEARRQSIPLHIVGIGSPRPPQDVRISELLVDDVAFVQDVLSFDFHVHSQGMAGREAVVRLMRQSNGETLAEQMIVLPADEQSLPLRLSHRPPQEGEFTYTVQIQAFEEEIDPLNNSITRSISVLDPTIRVLLVQSAPSYEFRFLRNLLSRALQRDGIAQTIDLTTVLQQADVELAATDAAVTTIFPVQVEDLREYDVLIIGDADPLQLSGVDLAHVSSFVRDEGGGLVLIAGPRFMPHAYQDTPLEDLLPFDVATAATPTDVVASEPFRVTPTDLGSDHPILQLGDTAEHTRQLWSELPELRWQLEVAEVNPIAITLAQSERQDLAGRNLPVLLTQFVGAGRVIFQATDETYLWARYGGNDTYYSRYWLQLIRYLSRSKLAKDRNPAELMIDATEYRAGEAVRMRVLFRDNRQQPEADDGVTVILEHRQGSQIPITLRRTANNPALFESSVTQLSVGAYQARLAAPVLMLPPPERQFTVATSSSEQAAIQMNSEDLFAAAAKSGGRFYTIVDALELPQALPNGKAVRVESLPPEPIWNSSWLAAAFVVLIAVEWIVRKRAGLL